jgi:hypothetical protein
VTDFDPTDPWGQKSPWDVAQPESQPTAQEAPVTTPPVASAAPNPFKIGFTLKASSGYDAEWLTPTVYGSSAEETAQRGKDLLLAMKSVGLIEFTAQAAEFTRGQFLGGGAKSAAAPAAKPTFQNGQVQYNQAPTSAPGDSCSHGRTQKSGTGAKGPWTAMFCNGPRGQQCDPLWQQKDGSFA